MTSESTSRYGRNYAKEEAKASSEGLSALKWPAMGENQIAMKEFDEIDDLLEEAYRDIGTREEGTANLIAVGSKIAALMRKANAKLQSEPIDSPNWDALRDRAGIILGRGLETAGTEQEAVANLVALGLAEHTAMMWAARHFDTTTDEDDKSAAVAEMRESIWAPSKMQKHRTKAWKGCWPWAAQAPWQNAGWPCIRHRRERL